MQKLVQKKVEKKREKEGHQSWTIELSSSAVSTAVFRFLPSHDGGARETGVNLSRRLDLVETTSGSAPLVQREHLKKKTPWENVVGQTLHEFLPYPLGLRNLLE